MDTFNNFAECYSRCVKDRFLHFICSCRLVIPEIVTGLANQSLPTSVPFIPSVSHPAVPVSNFPIGPAAQGITVV